MFFRRFLQDTQFLFRCQLVLGALCSSFFSVFFRVVIESLSVKFADFTGHFMAC
jgi:hypothetical protein